MLPYKSVVKLLNIIEITYTQYLYFYRCWAFFYAFYAFAGLCNTALFYPCLQGL